MEYYEKDYNDEVYEDEYYEENYDEEELDDGSHVMDDDIDHEGSDDHDEWDEEKKVTISFACDDCDYRWDDVIIKKKNPLDEIDEDPDIICPMCGSMNITQI